MLAKPKFEVRNKTLVRSQLVFEVLASMREGGSSFDVRERMIEVTGERHSILPVKECLAFLANIGAVECDNSSGGFWWSAKQTE